MNLKLYCLVLNYQNHLDTEKCVRSLLNSDLPQNSKILILDNSPTNTSLNFLKKKLPQIELLKNKRNFGFAGGNNPGIRLALAEGATHILIINPDVEVGKTFLRPLLKSLKLKPKIGLIAPTISHFQGRYQRFGLEGHLNWRLAKAFHTNLARPPQQTNLRIGDFVTFACVLIKSEVFENCGLLDERYFMYLEDVDYCLTAQKKGFLSAVDPTVTVNHVTSSSFKCPTDKLKISFISQIKFIHKWLKFPQKMIAYGYTCLFYPYLFFLWKIQSLRHQ
jgi:GT2 family glycosyltransferase